MVSALSVLLSIAVGAWASPVPEQAFSSSTFDIQAHRGGRGNAVESTLPSFAWGLIHGAKTLELDNGISKDGHVIVWHDESIQREKCLDTIPVTEDDPDFPYVGKYIANLTLAQLKTLDCGTQRLIDYPLQLTYPGTKLSTLPELFAFASCVDPGHKLYFNIESKIDPPFPNLTRSVDDFVHYQHEAFANSPYYNHITFQSFDWRSLVEMKKLDPKILTAALFDNSTLYAIDGSTSTWLAGLRPDDFEGDTIGEQIASAAKSIKTDILSPQDTASINAIDPTQDGYVPLASEELIAKAHELDMLVKPWTVNRLSVVQNLLDWGVDGLITDYPANVRDMVAQNGHLVATKWSKKKVLKCLDKYIQTV